MKKIYTKLIAFSKKKVKYGITSAILLLITFPMALTCLSGNIAVEREYDWENEKLIDTLIFFNSEGVDLGIPEQYIIYEYDALNGINALIPQSMYDDLKKADFVESIGVNSKVSVEPCEDILDLSIDAIQAERVWGLQEDAVNIAPGAITGQGVKVAVIDSGIDLDHEDLDDNYKGGYDFVHGDQFPEDEYGHGTKIAGIICAEDNGVGAIGVAPRVELYAVKVMDWAGRTSDSLVAQGINWAVANGMDVISMSFGGHYVPSYLGALNVAYNAGIVLVAATGNDGIEDIDYPAKLPNVIAVGAANIQKDLEPSFRCSYSNYGPELDLVASGGSYTTLNGGDYGCDSFGTSLAVPVVVGVIALMLEAHPTLTPAQVRARLHDTACDCIDHYGNHEEVPGYDIYTGYGVVEAFYAIYKEVVDMPPAKPTGLTAIILGPWSVSLSWNAINPEIDFDGNYILYRDGIFSFGIHNTYFIDSVDMRKQSHTYQVAAVDTYGNIGEKSEPVVASSMEMIPLPIVNLKVDDIDYTSITLSWECLPDPYFDHYRIYRNGVLILGTTKSIFTDDNLDPGTTYVYEISIVNVFDLEGEKVAITVTTKAYDVLYVKYISMYTEPWIIFFKPAIIIFVALGGTGNLNNVHVYFTLRLNNGQIIKYEAITSKFGNAWVKYPNNRLFIKGTYTCTVTNLEQSYCLYDSSLNMETSETYTIY